MDLSIKNTTKKQRAEIVKNAICLSITGTDIPSDHVLDLAKEYIDGKTEIEEIQRKIINMYKKEGDE